MSAPRLIALLLVIVEAIVFAYMLKGWVLIGILCGFAVVGAFGYYQLRLTPFRHTLAALVLALPFAAVWQTMMQNQDSITVVFSDNLGPAIAQYLIALQVLQFYIRHDRDMPRMFPFLGVIALLFCGDLFLRQDTQKLVFFGWCFLYAVLAAYYMNTLQPAAPHRALPRAPRRALWTALTLCAAMLLGWSTARSLEWAEREMARFFLSPLPLPTTQLGFARIARLDSMSKIRADAGQEAALRVFADRSPGYLRGAAYTRYLNQVWHTEEGVTQVPPALAWPPELQKHQEENVFPVQDQDAVVAQLRVWPTLAVQEVIFTPWQTAWIAAREEELERDVNGALRAPDGLGGQPYTAATTAESEGIEARDEYLALPEDLNPEIVALAQQICRDAMTAQAKIAAVTAYFGQHYEYELGITIPPDVEPLEYFLLNDPLPAGHCEFFASGAAILLRVVGVPARYVTGFMCHEQHPYGGYWVARNRDAHAWVEAFVPDTGWTIVEATPASGQPQGAPESVGRLRQAIDYMSFQWAQVKAQLFGGGISGFFWKLVDGLRWMLAASVTTWPGRGLWALLVLAALWDLLRKRRRRPHAEGLPSEPHVIALNKLLEQMDARLRKRGVVRRPEETLHQFAARLDREAAEEHTIPAWYRCYAEARYHGPPGPEHLAELKEALR
jgi:transglutaminase-like putative cysteine protease